MPTPEPGYSGLCSVLLQKGQRLPGGASTGRPCSIALTNFQASPIAMGTPVRMDSRMAKVTREVATSSSSKNGLSLPLFTAPSTSRRASACPPYRGLFPSPPLFDRMPTYRTQGKRSLNFLSARTRPGPLPCSSSPVLRTSAPPYSASCSIWAATNSPFTRTSGATST